MAVHTSPDKWTITGVSLATRKAARAAARRENMTLADWIERAVEQASEARVGKPSHEEISDHRPRRRYF